MEASQPDGALLAVLDRWKGSEVVVRVVTASDELVAVLRGRLQEKSDEKHPALFWPVESTESPKVERPGVYLHPASYEGARIHEGEFVVEFDQGGVTTNVRRPDKGGN